jgi:hypothetical protein
MARANLSSLADRDVKPLPPRTDPGPGATPAEQTAPTASTKRHGRPGEGSTPSEPEEALGADVPTALKRELKAAAAIHGEKMKHIVARAIRRELDRMNEDQ